MADFPRFDQLFRIGRDEILARNTALKTDVVDEEGSTSNALVGCGSVMNEEIVLALAVLAVQRMIGSATGENQDRLYWDWFELTRNDAAAALVTLRFTRAGVVTGTIAKDFVCRTAEGIEFVVLEDTYFGAADTQKDVPARAALVGTEGNVDAATITLLGTQLWDTTFTVTNLVEAAGGTVREGDEPFRERARQFWKVARRGTLDAIEFGALEVDGIGIAKTSEIPLYVDGSQAAQYVELAVADPSGSSNQALADLATTAIRAWRGAGIFVQTVAAATVLTEIATAYTHKAGFDTDVTDARVLEALLVFTNTLGAGETWRHGGAVDLVQRDPGVDEAEDVTIPTPSADVSATSVQIIRTTRDRIRINQD